VIQKRIEFELAAQGDPRVCCKAHQANCGYETPAEGQNGAERSGWIDGGFACVETYGEEEFAKEGSGSAIRFGIQES